MTAQISPSSSPLDPDTQAMLDSLQRAVDKALDRKRRLGHYAVIWKDNGPLLIGEDAPTNTAISTAP